MVHTEEMIKQLVPHIGKRADGLWQAYLIGGGQDRQMLKQIVENLYDQYVEGFVDESIVLMPPLPIEQLYGCYAIGTVWHAERPLFPIALSDYELNQHMVVVGRTGSGKSSFVKGLLRQVLKRIPIWVFDWKGTYPDVDPNVLYLKPGLDTLPFHFNPLDVQGIPQTYHKAYLRQILEIFLDSYLENLQLLTVQGVEYLFLMCLDHLLDQQITITFRTMYQWMQGYKGTFREMDWRTTLLNLLYKIVKGPLGQVMMGNSYPFDKLVRHAIVFELDALGNRKDRNFLTRTLLLRLYYHMQHQGRTDTLRLFVVLEEAHNILLRRGGIETTVEVILRQIREFGVGICIVDQHPSKISLPALGTYCAIAFNLRLREDQKAMASTLGLERLDYLGKLMPRFAIVKLQNRHLTPFLIQTPEVKKGVVKSLDGHQKHLKEHLSSHDLVQTKKEEIRVVREHTGVVRGFSEVVSSQNEVVRDIRNASKRKEGGLLWEEVFLVHICQQPLMGAVERYRCLGLNRYQGNKHRTSLLDKGFVRLDAIPTSSGRIKVMVPTSHGFDWLKVRGFSSPSDKEGSFEHLYWKYRLCAWFKREGFQVEMEVDLRQNRAIDLVVAKGGQQVGVEVETGKNTNEQILRNIQKNLKHVGGVVSFILNRQKARTIQALVKDDRAAVVSTAKACIGTVIERMGDVV